MNAAAMTGQAVEEGFGAWFKFWVPFAVLAFCVVLGGFFGGEGEAPGDQMCGVILILASAGLAFLRLKDWFDRGSTDCSSFLFVDTMAGLYTAIVVFIVLALVGVFTAAHAEQGGLYAGGVALFVTSGFGMFFSLKNVFDHAASHAGQHPGR